MGLQARLACRTRSSSFDATAISRSLTVAGRDLCRSSSRPSNAAAHPAARHRPKPRSQPRCHDAHHRLIAPSACRRTPLPASHRCRLAASNRTPYTVDQAKIALSTAAVAPNSPPQLSIRRRLRRPAHPQRKPPHRQIPIDGTVARPPRVPSWEAFGRRPSARADRSPRAGIRNPSPEPTLSSMAEIGRVGWEAVIG
jgi:hypothetical protein